MRSQILFLLSFVLGAYTFVPKEEEYMARLKKSIDAYNQKYQPVALHLSFSQPYYAVGDTVSFSAFYFNLASASTINLKQIANLEVYDEAGVKVADEKFVLKQGVAGVNVPVTATFKPGYYNMVAYTDWMKNFDKSTFFTRTIKIVAQNDMSAKDFDATFWPEGGHLISGVENKIHITIPECIGNVSGVIKSGSDIISQVSFNNGRGTARFAPSAGATYNLEIAGINSTTKSLPAVETSGVSLRTQQDGERTIAKLYYTSDLSTSGKNFYLAVINTTTLSYYTNLNPGKISEELVLGPRQISGPSILAVLSDDGKVWASVFTTPKAKDVHVNIDLEKSEVAVRDSVGVNLSIADNDGPVDGSISVSVFNSNLFGGETQGESTGLVPPTFNWLNWNMIFRGNIDEPSYKTLQYLTLEGDAFFADSNKPVADSTLLMFYFEKQVLGYEVYAFNGKFQVPVFFDFTEPDMVYYAASRRGRDLKGVTLRLKKQDSESYANKSSINAAIGSSIDAYGTFRSKTRFIQSSFQYFSVKKSPEVSDPNFAIEDELGGADVVVNLKDYLVFPTMAEVVKEVLPSVEHRRTGGQDMIKIYTSHKRPVNNAEPVYVIDGVITKSTATFLGLNTADVVSLKVIKNGSKLVRLGKLFDNGVILVRTNNNSGSKINRENIFPVRGLLPAISVKKTPAQLPKHIPNFRAVLMWNPQIKSVGAGARIKVPTSDDIGNFIVQVDAVTSDGRHVVASKPFSVSLPKQ